MFLGKTLESHNVSPNPGVERGTGEVSGEADQWHGVTYDGLASHPGEVVILLVT